MPQIGLNIQEGFTLLEELPSDTESEISSYSIEDDDYAPPQFPTEPPPNDFEEEISDEADDEHSFARYGKVEVRCLMMMVNERQPKKRLSKSASPVFIQRYINLMFLMKSGYKK
ncbi:hypothetical protein NPIL_15541 [Nephila pilipes]|uniref:Uncharacterized protein n=1 Tax=Nephila pilipes TaxID=299642 RepID=A0A8X6Q0U7_NEPPI|nr:hypothetical protein NPIL_15541 [Nephila pilipes]